MADITKLKSLLHDIYGPEKGEKAAERILALLSEFPSVNAENRDFFSEQDIYLITYGDSLLKAGERPLQSLQHFAAEFLKGVVQTIHFLPFFPYSSDDGFSVKDFFTINPDLGTWADIASIGKDFDLMFDFVINHFSAQSEWFDNYLSGKAGFEDFAIEVDPARDLSGVTRPRALPLLTEVTKRNGETAHVWTTFSADQIDFNYESPDVLEKMIEVMLFYVKQGARTLRLDAIAYLWKSIGTDCIHRPQTHAMVKLFRCILDMVAPHVIIITETNVPHPENISYFGNGADEAQMVYNFTLPPLLLYTFLKEDTTALSRWAQGLASSGGKTTFFNFTASHDGIGVRPLEGILPDREIQDIVVAVQNAGGQVSYKQNTDGSKSPYELNITYVDAILSDPASENAEKFMASQAIQYSLPGVPATYIHSLLGSRNWHAGVSQTGRARTINRERLDLETLISELDTPAAFRARVFNAYLRLMQSRKSQAAFHPNADFRILNLHPGLFAVRRSAPHQTIYAIVNVSSRSVSAALPDEAPSICRDLLSGMPFGTTPLSLTPYQYVWLTADALL